MNEVNNLITVIDNRITSHKTPNNKINIDLGTVIAVNPDTNTATVELFESKNTYSFYNKTGELLNEEDTVRIYYTTNVAKGWIGERLGEPNIEKQEDENRKIIVRSILPNQEFGYTTTHTSYSCELPQADLPVCANAGGLPFARIGNRDVGEFIVVSNGSQIILNGIDDNGDFVAKILSISSQDVYDREGHYQHTQYSYSWNTGASQTFNVPNHETVYMSFTYNRLTLINGDWYLLPSSSATAFYGSSSTVLLSFSGTVYLPYEMDLYHVVYDGRYEVEYNTDTSINRNFYANSFDIELENYVGAVSIPQLSNIANEINLFYEWGDGTSEQGVSSESKSHTYLNRGYYRIRIYAERDLYSLLGKWNSLSTNATFNARDNIRILKLPNGIHRLNLGKFTESSKMLETVWLSDKTEYLNMSFKDCENLSVCILGNSITEFGELTSFRNTGLYSVSIPQNITSVPAYCFADCKRLNNISISSAILTEIPEGTFMGCSNLSTVNFNQTVLELIGHKAFLGTKLARVNLGTNTRYYKDSFPETCVVTGGILITD